MPQAKILGKKVRLIHTSFEDKWHITPQRLAEFLEGEHDIYRPRILVLNYPGNPDGQTYTPDQLKEIAEVARKYELILLSDEIYGQLHHRGEHISVASETYTSVSAPIQYAAVHAFRGGVAIERYLWHARRVLSTLGKECHHILIEAGVRVHPPEGGFYLFLDFTPVADRLSKRGITDSKTLCERLLQETGVAMLPGTDFERPYNELTARLSYINFNGANALATSETIPLHDGLTEGFLQQMCPDTIEGTKLIADWISVQGESIICVL